MQTDDYLAALLRRNLSMHSTDSAQSYPQYSEAMDVEIESSPPVVPSPVYSISQHYHHSSHAVRHPDQQPVYPQVRELTTSASEPVLAERPSVEAALLGQGIDSLSLTPTELQLFRTAGQLQQQRLIELWHIFTALPVSPGHVDAPEAMSLDGTQVPVQSADGCWTADDAITCPEPYMASGYIDVVMAGHHISSALDAQARFSLVAGATSSCIHAETIPTYPRCTPPMH